MSVLKRNVQLNEINDVSKSVNKKINIINVNYDFKKAFSKISKKSNKYIEECFNLSLKIMKEKNIYALINGPISKKHF